MIDRELQRQIEQSWRESKSTTATEAQRLESMIEAFLLSMRPIVDAVESVQQFWDNADMNTLLAATGTGEALDTGGTVTKESVVKYQVLFLSFKEWLAAATEADVLGRPVTLDETSRQLITRQPEKVSKLSESYKHTDR